MARKMQQRRGIPVEGKRARRPRHGGTPSTGHSQTAPPQKENSAQAYWMALGRFVHMFSQIEMLMR
jgi:hypothetical protein